MTNNLDVAIKNINDDTYKTKFIELPRIINEWTSEYGGLSNNRILDFGCGEGTTAMGIALQYKTSSVTGIEIQSEIENCLPLAKKHLGVDKIPENLDLKRIKPGQSLDELGTFDIVYSWSVFEHVEQQLLSDVLSSIRKILNPNGLFFMQIAPLYYSAEGSHMLPWIPEPGVI